MSAAAVDRRRRPKVTSLSRIFAQHTQTQLLPESPGEVLRALCRGAHRTLSPCHLVFAIPKALRGLFHSERCLLGLLSCRACQVVRLALSASFPTCRACAADFHHQIHILVTAGAFPPEGAFLAAGSVQAGP